jgi:hypothetical protein
MPLKIRENKTSKQESDPHHSSFDHLAAGSKALKRHGHEAVVDHPTDHGAAEAARGQERLRRALGGRRLEEGERAMMLGTQAHSWGSRSSVFGFQYPVDRGPTEQALSLRMAQLLHLFVPTLIWRRYTTFVSCPGCGLASRRRFEASLLSRMGLNRDAVEPHNAENDPVETRKVSHAGDSLGKPMQDGVRDYSVRRFSGILCSSVQSGRTTAPRLPHLAHRTCGPNDVMKTSSCQSSTLTVLA